MPGGHMLLPYHYGGIISLNTCLLLSHKLVIVIVIWGPFGAILPSSTKMIKNMYLDLYGLWLQMCHDYPSAQALIQLHHWHLYVTKQDHYDLLQELVGEHLTTGGFTWPPLVDTGGVVTIFWVSGNTPAGPVFYLYIQK